MQHLVSSLRSVVYNGEHAANSSKAVKNKTQTAVLGKLGPGVSGKELLCVQAYSGSLPIKLNFILK